MDNHSDIKSEISLERQLSRLLRRGEYDLFSELLESWEFGGVYKGFVPYLKSGLWVDLYILLVEVRGISRVVSDELVRSSLYSAIAEGLIADGEVLVGCSALRCMYDSSKSLKRFSSVLAEHQISEDEFEICLRDSLIRLYESGREFRGVSSSEIASQCGLQYYFSSDYRLSVERARESLDSEFSILGQSILVRSMLSQDAEGVESECGRLRDQYVRMNCGEEVIFIEEAYLESLLVLGDYERAQDVCDGLRDRVPVVSRTELIRLSGLLGVYERGGALGALLWLVAFRGAFLPGSGLGDVDVNDLIWVHLSEELQESGDSYAVLAEGSDTVLYERAYVELFRDKVFELGVHAVAASAFVSGRVSDAFEILAEHSDTEDVLGVELRLIIMESLGDIGTEFMHILSTGSDIDPEYIPFRMMAIKYSEDIDIIREHYEYCMSEDLGEAFAYHEFFDLLAQRFRFSGDSRSLSDVLASRLEVEERRGDMDSVVRLCGELMDLYRHSLPESERSDRLREKLRELGVVDGPSESRGEISRSGSVGVSCYRKVFLILVLLIVVFVLLFLIF